MRKILSLTFALLIILSGLPMAAVAGMQTSNTEYAWVLVEINDYENADKWAASDAHESYIVTHSYSRGVYSASTTYEGDDPYDQGRSGTLAVRAVFSGMPDIIYPGEPVSLKLTFVPTEDSVVALSFSASASANFDQWDVKPGGATGRAIAFVNAEGEDHFTITGTRSVSYDEILTAGLGSGYENSRIALRLGFYMGVSMGTNYVYEWQQVGDTEVKPTEAEPTNEATTKPWSNYVEDRSSPSGQVSICRIADLYGEVNVRPNDEDDDAYIFAWSGMQLYHNDRVKTLTRSGCIISFSDMSSYIMKEDSTIVLDIANEKESKIALVAGNVWINLKRLIKDGSMEVEMSQAIAGARGTTFICEENNGVSVLKVFEGTVEFSSKISGNAVTVQGGQMITADHNGLGEITPFDMDIELETWDADTQEMTANAMGRGKSWLGIVVVLIIIIIMVAVLLIAALVAILLYKKRKI
jgi:hypothetical protein